MKAHRGTVHITAILLVALLLGGCGFQLRGTQGLLPEHVQPVHVTGLSAGSELGRALRLELEIAGATLSETAAGARVQLRVLSNETERRVLSIDPRARAAEVVLTETAVFEVRDRQGSILLGPVTAQERRVMLDDPDRRTDKAAEERSLREGMTRELAARMVRQLRNATRQLPQEP